MTDTTVPPEFSAENLVAAGAAPVTPDVTALMDQLQALQKRFDEAQAAAGVPTNPVEAAAKNLKDHVAARQASSPDKADALKDLANEIDKLGDTPTRDQADVVRVTAQGIRSQVEGLDYIQDLADVLYKQVLKG